MINDVVLDRIKRALFTDTPFKGAFYLKVKFFVDVLNFPCNDDTTTWLPNFLIYPVQ